jgi:ubiquitin carboxyl-terminal hydrolase 16/45
VKGLQNLGNTCFFNAVMQCLSRSVPLINQRIELEQHPTEKVALLPKRSKQHEPTRSGLLELTLPTVPAGSLTESLTEFIITMNNGSSKGKKEGTINPAAMLDEICNKAPRFKGYQQHDSHELLRELLDALENEERKQVQEILLVHFGIYAYDFTSPDFKALDKTTQELIRAYLRSFQPVSTKLFRGELASSIICKTCNTASQTTEQFLDISVPIQHGTGNKGGGKLTVGQTYQHSKVKSAKLAKKQRKKEEAEKKRAAKAAKRDAKRGGPGKKLKGNGKGKGPAEADEPEAAAAPAVESGDAATATAAGGNAAVDVDDDVGFGFGDDGHGDGGNDDDELDFGADSGGGGSGGAGGGSGAEDDEEFYPTDPLPPPLEIPVQYGPIREPPEIRSGECSVYSCFQAFCAEEMLTGTNMYACESCFKKQQESGGGGAGAGGEGAPASRGGSVSSVGSDGSESKKEPGTIKSNAVKQLLIKKASQILTLHIKRFEQRGMRMEKTTTHVSFPLLLDISYFCGKDCTLSVYDEGEAGIRYGLYGVVVHQGKINSGHYIAYVKTGAAAVVGTKDPAGAATWWEVSDSQVSRSSEANVLRAQAYLLFYERLA